MKFLFNIQKKLLSRDATKRIGVFDKNEIKSHPFFKDINWKKLLSKEISCPYKFGPNFLKKRSDNSKNVIFLMLRTIIIQKF